MTELLEEWVNKAAGDYHTALRESEAAVNPNYDAVCFHAQQCIEKLIKIICPPLAGVARKRRGWTSSPCAPSKGG